MTCTFCNKTPVKHCPGFFFFNYHIWLIFTALVTKLVQYNVFLRATMRLESSMRLESRAVVGVHTDSIAVLSKRGTSKMTLKCKCIELQVCSTTHTLTQHPPCSVIIIGPTVRRLLTRLYLINQKLTNLANKIV